MKLKDKSWEWKIQLCMNVNFISSKDTGETHTIYLWSDIEEIRLGNETDDIIKELFKSFLNNYQKEEQIMRGSSEFIFESIQLLDYHPHKISLKRGKSYIKSPKWLEKKTATINPQNKYNNNFFQYAITVALNHQNIENNPGRISNIKPFINQHNWKDLNIKAHQKEDRENLEKNNMTIDWEKFEQNIKTIALNILFVPHNTKSIRLAYKSKYIRKRKTQVVLLMITNGKKWHYLALKNEAVHDGKKWCNCPVQSLPKLFRGIILNHNSDFYCLGCLHSFRTKNALKKHERLCDKHDYCHVKMPTEDNKILKYNQREKSLKAPFTIYFGLECLLKKSSLVKTILKNLILREKLSMNLQVGQCLQSVHLIKKKIDMIIKEK